MPDIFETTDAAAGTGTTYTLQVGQTAQGTLNASGDHDWYRVNLVAGQTYTFAMVGTGTSGVQDAYLRIYGPNGTTIVGENDDGLPNQNAIVTFTATTSGTYYIDAGAFNNVGSGQYGVSVALGTRATVDVPMGAGIIDAFGSGFEYAWSATPGTAATVSVGFRNTDDGLEPNFSRFTAAQMEAMTRVLQNYSEVANITFNVVNPGGYTDNATILLSNYNFNDGSGGYASYPGSTAASSQAGDVHINLAGGNSTSSLPYGSYSYSTLLHEMGHAVGLSHPGLYNAGSGQNITYGTHAQFTQDTHQYTVMSYFDESFTTGSYGAYADTLMLYDVYALQQIYGANMSTRAGNTVYGFNSTAGGVYDFTTNTSPALCIWDGGGTDTLDCSGFGNSQVIRLWDGAFSDVGGFTGNISIAYGAVIENAVTGSGSDTIHLSSANINNLVNAGAGSDTVYVSYAFGSGYSVQAGSTATNLILAGSAGTDTLQNVEFVRFSDGTTVATSSLIATNTAPVVTVPDITLQASQWDTLSRYLTYLDAQGNPVVRYEIRDNGTGASSGYLWSASNGGTQAAGTTFTVEAANFYNVWIRGGTAAGSETMQVRAFDGALWSDWDTFTLTTTVPTSNTAPVVTVPDFTLQANQWDTLSRYLTYTDADGNPVVRYEIRDNGTGAGSGYLWSASNGGTQAAGTTFTVEAANFYNVWVRGGTIAGADNMQVRAFDGTSWSAWDTFTLTTTVPTSNNPPVVNMPDLTLQANQWSTLDRYLTYSDADGNPVVRYEIRDNGTGAGSGYLWSASNGGTQAAGTTFTVEAANFYNVWIRGGSVAGADNMQVRAFDGTSWSAWDTFILTTTTSGPMSSAAAERTAQASDTGVIAPIVVTLPPTPVVTPPRPIPDTINGGQAGGGTQTVQPPFVAGADTAIQGQLLASITSWIAQAAESNPAASVATSDLGIVGNVAYAWTADTAVTQPVDEGAIGCKVPDNLDFNPWDAFTLNASIGYQLS